MRKVLTYGALLVCSAAALAMTFAQEPARPGAAAQADPLDRLLADFAAAVAKFDVEAAEKLFVPPDSTPDGQNRQGHISEFRKDWTRAKAEGASQGLAVEFKNTKKFIRTNMLISGPGGARDSQAREVEFVVEFTGDGWRIVSMNNGSGR